MRDAFARELTRLAEQDPRVVLLSGDIGNRMFDDFKSRFASRFYNCGVAEANMMGVAAGLASSGLRPVVYTIAPFVTTRCLEQIRVDVCYHEMPVVITGVGGGLAYASLGATHHSCEDLAMLRVLPGMNVVCPADPIETRLALQAALANNRPTYLRLGKKGEPSVHTRPPKFEIGTAITIREGGAIALLCSGTLLPLAVAAGASLEQKGKPTRVVSMHTVKPLDEQLLNEVFRDCEIVATVEEHSRLGGLGGAVAEWLADHHGLRGRLVRLGTPDRFLHLGGNQDNVREDLGLTPEAIASAIEQAGSQDTAKRGGP